MMSKHQEVVTEIFNRLNHVIEIHPYLSGFMTKEYQNYLHTLAEELGFQWRPSNPHEDWEIIGDEILRVVEDATNTPLNGAAEQE